MTGGSGVARARAVTVEVAPGLRAAATVLAEAGCTSAEKQINLLLGQSLQR